MAGLLAIEHAWARQVSPPSSPRIAAGVPSQKVSLPSYPPTLQPSEPINIPPTDPAPFAQLAPPPPVMPPADPGALAQLDPAPPPLATGEIPPLSGEPALIPPDPAALPAAEATPLPADPVEQVGALTERIQVRRAEDVASVQALVEQLAAQAEVQRAALARTEEALQAARSLEGELTREAPRIEPEDIELPEPALEPLPR
jgi:hypothetical protein